MVGIYTGYSLPEDLMVVYIPGYSLPGTIRWCIYPGYSLPGKGKPPNIASLRGGPERGNTSLYASLGRVVGIPPCIYASLGGFVGR